MARSKDKDTDNGQQSVFPEGYQMNAWSDDSRDTGIAAYRSRADESRPNNNYRRNKGRLWFPLNEIPEDMKYIFATNTLLNEPQADNLQELYENGYDFVKQSSHPKFVNPELHRHSDDRIRKGACVVMKKPKAEYEADQKASQDESTRRQKDVLAATDCFGAPAGPPRFVVENSGSYTPNYSDRRG
jgi:hypothetical protein